MLRRIAGVLVVALAVGGLVLAEDTRGVITKVDSTSITVRTGGFGKDAGNAEEKTFKITPGVAITKVSGKDKEETKVNFDDLRTAVRVTNVNATISHEGDNVTAIKVGGGGRGGFGGKGKGKNKNN